MAAEPLILAVDDEPGILRLLKLELIEMGFRVVTVSDPKEAVRTVEEQQPALILLDVLMPGMNGLEVLSALREHGNTPVIFVTAKDQDADKVRGLMAGADDYIVKPFSADELGARIRAVLRRWSDGAVEGHVVRAGDLEIDLGRRTVTLAGKPVDLTRTEWALLQNLAAHAGRVLLGTELLISVWGPEYVDELQYLRVWISRLRHKIEAEPANPKIIMTLPGVGYVLRADTPDAVAEADAPKSVAQAAPA